MTVDTLNDSQDAPLGPCRDRKRKILVVVDQSPESRVAIRFGAGRAAHVQGGELHLFHVIPPGEFQHWIAVEAAMRDEAFERAEDLMGRVAERVKAYSGLDPVIHIEEGDPKACILDFIRREPDMFLLVLGAGEGEGPGPLVDYFSGPLAAELSCPLVIVPGAMTREQVDALV